MSSRSSSIEMLSSSQRTVELEPLLLAGCADQQAGEGDQAGEALGADHRSRRGCSSEPPLPAVEHRPGDASSATSNSPRWRSRSSARRSSASAASSGGARTRAFSRQERTQEMSWRERGVLGLVDHAAALDAVGGRRLAKRRRTWRSRARPARRSARGRRSSRVPCDLAHLPLGARRVVAAVEVLGRLEVVLGLGRVGDLAPDPGEAKDADGLALVRVADQIELAVAEDQVVGVDLALGDLVALHRVVAELDRLAARDRRLDLGQALRELAAAAVGREADVDRHGLALVERARPAPGDLLQREPQRLGVGELAVEQAERRAQRGQLAVGELDRRQVVVLGRQRVELGLEEALGRLLDLERDAEALELGTVGVEAARERVLVHRAVALDLPLDLERRDGPAVRHQERDQ